MRRGVIEPLPIRKATKWCTKMVLVAKKSGHLRHTVDYQLIAACLRETHHIPVPFDIVL